jgi:hypothetical protein
MHYATTGAQDLAPFFMPINDAAKAQAQMSSQGSSVMCCWDPARAAVHHAAATTSQLTE